MILREFENGYWYLDDIRDFARQIGIPETTKLRKDEIERAVVAFLRTGTVNLPTKRALRKTGTQDLEHGLGLNLRIDVSKDYASWVKARVPHKRKSR